MGFWGFGVLGFWGHDPGALEHPVGGRTGRRDPGALAHPVGGGQAGIDSEPAGEGVRTRHRAEHSEGGGGGEALQAVGAHSAHGATAHPHAGPGTTARPPQPR